VGLTPRNSWEVVFIDDGILVAWCALIWSLVMWGMGFYPFVCGALVGRSFPIWFSMADAHGHLTESFELWDDPVEDRMDLASSELVWLLGDVDGMVGK